MINWNLVYAMVLRYFIYLKHNWDRLTDMFYWPVFDLFLWGLTGIYFAQLSQDVHHAVNIILAGLILWIVIWRAQYEITVNVMSEIWDKNLVNIFASPITVQEWIASLLSVGFIKVLISVVFSAIAAFIFYRYNILMYGSVLIPCLVSLLLTGWAAGFFVAGILIRYGVKVQTFAWTGVAILAPFSGLYYPLSVLPIWAQKIAIFVPSSYIFEGLREILFTGSFSYDKLLVSFVLNIIYLVLGISFFIFMFNRSRKLGLGRLI